MVPGTGFEPVIFAVRGRCPRPLDEPGALGAVALTREAWAYSAAGGAGMDRRPNLRGREVTQTTVGVAGRVGQPLLWCLAALADSRETDCSTDLERERKCRERRQRMRPQIETRRHTVQPISGTTRPRTFPFCTRHVVGMNTAHTPPQNSGHVRSNRNRFHAPNQGRAGPREQFRRAKAVPRGRKTHPQVPKRPFRS